MLREAQLDRSIRRLTSLQETASTARVLNLLSVYRRYGEAPEVVQAPVFRNRLLNRSIILKHRLRANEHSEFAAPRSNVTKLLIPMDPADLRVGARYIFLGQRDFDAVASSLFADDLKPGARDRVVLELIDQLPSLDPFLLREHLRQNGVEPARAYFAVSDADIQRMYDFVRHEVGSLVALSGQGGEISAARFVEKLLSPSADISFEPLREILGLSEREYEEGIFCWRGFLYYKWVLSDIARPAREISEELLRIQPRGARDPDALDYLKHARPRIVSAVKEILGGVRRLLAAYDRAYSGLTKDAKPAAFRDFLLAAPSMFNDLGERLGAIQHVVSFWRYRFPPGRPQAISPADLMDLFLDFEDGLTVSQHPPALGNAA
jgi:hypothetical protein